MKFPIVVSCLEAVRSTCAGLRLVASSCGIKVGMITATSKIPELALSFYNMERRGFLFKAGRDEWKK